MPSLELNITIFAVMTCVFALWALLSLRARQNLKSQMTEQLKLQQQSFADREAHFQQARVQAERDLERERQTVHAQNDEITNLKIALAQEKVKATEQQKFQQVQTEQFELSKSQLKQEFENLSNRLFESKQEQFVKNAKSNLEQVIQPFHLQLKDFYTRLEHTHKDEAEQRSRLHGQILELQKQSQKISDEALNLTQALKGNNKTVGTWGELILARILENSGMLKGREFELQVSTSGESGRRLQPDAVVHLPEGKEIVVDSKVSLLSYEKLVTAEDEDQRNIAEKEFLDSIKAHIRSLSAKRYGELFGIQGIEFVFLFIPLESAFALIAQSQAEILNQAFEKNIVIVGPANLLVALKTIESLWQRDRQDKNIEKLIESAGKLHDQFVLYTDSLGELGQSLEKAQDSYNKALSRLSTGKGNVVKRVADLKLLGAKVNKRLAKSILEEASETDE